MDDPATRLLGTMKSGLMYLFVLSPILLVAYLTVSQRHSSMPLPTQPSGGLPALDCNRIIHDDASPHIVHSLVAGRVKGKAAVAVGTRNGTGIGISCWSRVAATAVAVEADPTNPSCKKLTRHSGKELAAGNYTVHCDAYQSHAPDADVYTWWQQSPHLELTNEQILRHLRSQQRRGRIRPSAEAVLIFDHSVRVDRASWSRLGRHMAWQSTVAFDEREMQRAECRQPLPAKPTGSPTGSPKEPLEHDWCASSGMGTFTVGSMPISRADNISRWSEAMGLVKREVHTAWHGGATRRRDQS